ncbi:MAG: HU family DNA-binding protein [Phycisphaeraceae bacterium]|nr:HU family DNA-binding protein [Phycisphaeraceae bacterium]
MSGGFYTLGRRGKAVPGLTDCLDGVCGSRHTDRGRLEASGTTASSAPSQTRRLIRPLKSARQVDMATVTKKELVDSIAEATDQKQVVVKQVVQGLLDQVIVELGKGNRLELRDFGVFEVRQRQARKAQNPKTLEPVYVPPKRTVKFKPGRLMRETLEQNVSLDDPSAGGS